MRESVGGALMLRIFLVVIVIFVVFIAVSANYARAFRVKNRVIDILEQYEGYTKKAKIKISSYISSSGYSCGGKTSDELAEYVVGDIDNVSNGIRYNVKTCVEWHFPILNALGTWEIKGKTDIIRTPADDIRI